MFRDRSIVGKLGPLIIILLTLLPLFALIPNFSKGFTLRNVSQALALSGTVLLSINFILAARFKFIERFFSGLNRVYVIHHLVGVYALVFLLFHPVSLGVFYLNISLEAAFNVLFPPFSNLTPWFGTAALMNMIALLILTLYVNLPYHIWKITHKFLGLTLLLASVHIFFASSTIANNQLLRYYIFSLLSAAAFSYLYRTVLGKYFVKRYKYQVSGITTIAGATEVSLIPLEKEMEYLPGQFIFISFDSIGVTHEEHPFSIVSKPGSKTLLICAKSVGNYTETMKLLRVGSNALIEGPFGDFSYTTKTRRKQVWIAGGIGITPFVSMVRDLNPQGDYDVELFYTTSVPQEALYLPHLEEIAKTKLNLRILPVYSKIDGRLTASAIAQKTADLKERDILICGPAPMMKSLRQQFNEIGVKNLHIFSEEFTIN